MSWKKIIVLFQALAFAVVPLGVANAIHVDTLDHSMHEHFTLSGTQAGHSEAHQNLSTGHSAFEGMIKIDIGSMNDIDDPSTKICCHFGGGACTPVAVVPVSELVALSESQTSLKCAFFGELVYIAQSGIFHPPRLIT